jgi:hypothetical protein
MTPNIAFAFFIHLPRNCPTIPSDLIGMEGGMDWKLAIDINREALKRILVGLVAMAGFGAMPSLGAAHHAHGPERTSLPRHLHRAVLRLLRPAEAAARRLVIVAARGIVVAPPPLRQRKTKAKPSLFVRNGVGTGVVLRPGMARPSAWLPGAGRARAARPLSLPLLDPVRDPLRRRRPKSSGVPRIRGFDGRDPVAVPARRAPLPDDPIDATRLGLRLAAVGRVLDDLPKHAKRFARWRSRVAAAAQEERRDALGEQDQRAAGKRPGGRFRRRWPLKPGLPPGARRPGSRRKPHEIDEILSNTHGLAFFVLAHPDTS